MAMPGIGPISGGQGGVDLSSGPAKSGASGSNRTGGATFYFAEPKSAQTAGVIGQAVPWLAVGVVAWLVVRKIG